MIAGPCGLLALIATGPLAEAAEPTRVAVLVEDGTDAQAGPVEDSLRGSALLRVVGPVDRPAPRTSPQVRALGESLDVALLAVIVRRDEALQLRVFEVRRGAYFEGTLSAPFDPIAVREFVERRAGREPRRAAPRRSETSWRTWAGLGVAVAAIAAFAAVIAFGGSDEAPDTVAVDVVR